MKVTNYENSKRLAEIWFKAPHCGGWFAEGGFTFDISADFDWAAYDLETILEALPDSLNHLGFETQLELTKDAIGYYATEGDEESGFAIAVEISKKENESLADCAARLLIMLFEKKLIEVK